jgi:hypothetical protein
VELLSLEEEEGQDDLDIKEDEGVPSLIISNVFAITSL